MLFKKRQRIKERTNDKPNYTKGGTLKVPLWCRSQTPEMKKNLRFLRLPAVIEKVGLGRSTIYKRMQEGTFPKCQKNGPRIVVWNEYELDQWCLEVVK